MAQAVPTTRAASADRRLLTARSAALLACGTLAALFALAVPAHYAQLVELRNLPTGIEPGELRANLAGSRMTIGFYAGYQVAMQIGFAVVCLVLALTLVWRPSVHRVVPLVAVLLALIGTTFWNTVGALAQYDPVLGRVGELLGVLAKCSLLAFLLVFPDGRFVPGWTRNVAAALGIGVVSEAVLGDASYAIGNWPPALFLLMIATFLAVAVHAQVHRYRHVSGPAERQQTKWVVAGVAGGVAGFLLVVLVAEVWLSVADPGTPGELVTMTLVTAALLLIPVSISIAVQRHHLYEIDLIINRALVFGVLSAGVVGLYVLAVVSLSSVFGDARSLPASLAAAGLVAVLFAPVRERVQRAVNHLMYGERDDPYAVLTRLGRRLEATTTGAEVLPAAVAAVADALKLPYVALEVDRPHGAETVASTGAPVVDPLVLPLSYGGETLGRLVLGRRAGSPASRRPTGGCSVTWSVRSGSRCTPPPSPRRRPCCRTTSSGPASGWYPPARRSAGGSGATSTTAWVPSSRASPCRPRPPVSWSATTRSGPPRCSPTWSACPRTRSPTSGGWSTDCARRRWTRSAWSVRFAAAVTLQEVGGMRVDLTAADPLPSLPAAVEVAAYRLVTEAVTNAARHSGGAMCRVRLEPVAAALEVEVTDDGRGVAEAARGGVGLGSMRERAEELGGSFTLGSTSTGGTRVLARLPFREGA